MTSLPYWLTVTASPTPDRPNHPPRPDDPPSDDLDDVPATPPNEPPPVPIEDPKPEGQPPGYVVCSEVRYRI